jgi:DNA topoisomerase-1
MTDRPDPEESAEEAGLRYVTDASPGITRHRAGKGMYYRNSKGEKITDKRTLARIKSLAIPPAWTDVWIAPSANAHLQATGRDAKGRKQYRYHPRWGKVRDEAKYEHMLEFARALPAIRERVDADLGKRGLPREKVLAALVKLLETTLIRVGNDQYAKENKSYGLTTMRDRHADIEGSRVTFSFTGKSGVDHEIELKDRRLASIVRKCQELPGQHLFQYIDEDGNRQSVGSGDVNAYLKEISGHDFTAKDFRTWAGTMLAAEALAGFDIDADETKVRGNIVSAIENVSKRLGNTPTICRKCYVHPAVIDAYMDGDTVSTNEQQVEKQRKENGLPPLEHAVMELLVRRLHADMAAAISG